MESVHYSCRVTEKPEPGAEVWEKADNAEHHICSRDGDNSWSSYSGYQCPEGTFCGSPLDYGLPQDEDIRDDVRYQFGFGIFSDIGDSIYTVFQIITMDNWTWIMYNMAWHDDFYVPTMFCTACVMIGSFFSINLMLAVIMDAYDQSSQTVDD